MGVLDTGSDLWFPFECGGKTYYLPKACPHRGGRLDLGYLNPAKGLVVCPLHKSTFCVPGGKLLSGPASAGLKVAAVRPEPGAPTGEESDPVPEAKRGKRS